MGQASNRLQLMPILLVIFIDSVGLGLVYPVLSVVMLEPSQSFFQGSYSFHSRTVLYGVVTGVFSLTWFFGAAYVSQLSDQIGRKKSLLICLVGSAIGFVITGIGIIEHSLSLIIIGRAIDGFTAGSQPVAQATAVDLAEGGNRSRYLSLVILAMTLGFVAGPLLGGVLSDSHLVSWFSYDTPMFFAGLLCLINIAALVCWFKETHPPRAHAKARLFEAVHLIIHAAKTPAVRNLSVLFFTYLVGWACFYTFISPFSILAYHLDGQKVIYLMVAMGIGFTIGNAWLVNVIPATWSRARLIQGSWLMSALLTAGVLLINSLPGLVVLVVLMGIMASLGYTYTIGAYSDLADDENQGLIMGISGSVIALGFTVTQFLGGYLLGHGTRAPMILAVGAFFLAGVLFFFYRQPSRLAPED